MRNISSLMTDAVREQAIRCAGRRLTQRSDAEEAVHTAWIRLQSEVESSDLNSENFEGIFLTYVRWTSLDLQKQNRRRKAMHDRCESEGGVPQFVDKETLWETLTHQLSRLQDEREKRALAYRFQRYTLKEIAKKLGTSVSMVTRLMASGIAALADLNKKQ